MKEGSKMKKYFGYFDSLESVLDSFGVSAEYIGDIDVIFAEYENWDYEGYAHVIYMKDGKLFEVNSSHCSCNGLDWEAEETTLAALLSRPNVSDMAKKNLQLYFN